MYTRVTHQMLASNFLRNLTSIARRIEYAQEQLATGKALLKPSDGPIQVARILQYNLSISQITQFKMNIGDGISQVEKAGSTLLDVENALQDAREHAVDGVSDNMNTQDRLSIASTIDQLMNSVLQSANDNFKGRFMFAGYHTQDQPFHEIVSERSGYIDNVTYTGSLGSIERRIGRYSNLPVNFNGFDTFINRPYTYEGKILPADKPLGFTGTLTINDRDFYVDAQHTLTDIRNLINSDNETGVFAEVRINQLILSSTSSSGDITLSDSLEGDLLQNLGLAQRGAYTIGTAAPALPLVDSTPAIFTGFGAVANLTYDSTNNRMNLRVGPDADPYGAGQAHNIYIPEQTYASVADLATALQGEIDTAFGKDVLIVSEAAGVLSFTTVATGDAVTAGNLVIGGTINGLDDNASDFNDLNLVNADPAPATFAGIAGVDGNDKLVIDIGNILSISDQDIVPQTIDLRAANTGTLNELVDEINFQLYENSYLRGVVKASAYDGRLKIESVETGDHIPASELVITDGATGTLTALNLELNPTPAYIEGAVLPPGGFPITITGGLNDQLTLDLGPTVSSEGIELPPITITLTAGNYANTQALVDDINLQIRRNMDLYGSVQAVVGGTVPNEFIQIESIATGSRIRGEDLGLSGSAAVTLGLPVGIAVNGGGTTEGEGVHLEPQNIFDTLIDLRDDLRGVAAGDSKLVNMFNGNQESLALMDGDTITISTSLKSVDIDVLVFHRVDDLVFAFNEFFGTQAHVSLTRDGRLEFENLETAQIADLSITAKSAAGETRDVFENLFKNFPSNIPGGSKVVSEEIIDPQRYVKITDIELGRIDIEIEKMLGFQAIVGARSNRMATTRNLFEDSELNIRNLKTDLEDADFAEVITNLSQMEMVLEAALNVGARVLTPTLIQFLR